MMNMTMRHDEEFVVRMNSVNGNDLLAQDENE
jgi:hypothetical protein